MAFSKQYIVVIAIMSAVLASILVMSDAIFIEEASENFPIIGHDFQSDSKIELPQASYVENPQLSTYRIDDTCELLYSITHSVYPNNDPLQQITMTGVVDKYPQQFSQWEEIFSNKQQLESFAQQGFSEEFLDEFSWAVMQEYSIHPDLKSIVSMTFDQSLAQEVEGIFNENNCFGYFESRQNGN